MHSLWIVFKNVSLLMRHEISYLYQANSRHFSSDARDLLAFGWNWWSSYSVLSKITNNILFPFLQTLSAHKTTSSLCWQAEYNSWMQIQRKLEEIKTYHKETLQLETPLQNYFSLDLLQTVVIRELCQLSVIKSSPIKGKPSRLMKANHKTEEFIPLRVRECFALLALNNSATAAPDHQTPLCFPESHPLPFPAMPEHLLPLTLIHMHQDLEGTCQQICSASGSSE